MRIRQRLCPILNVTITLAVAVGLEGCNVSPSATPTPSSAQMFRARISGGIQPISNGSIQLYTPGTNGYGSASTPLLNQPVTTDANGSFSLEAIFPARRQQLPSTLLRLAAIPGWLQEQITARLL